MYVVAKCLTVLSTNTIFWMHFLLELVYHSHFINALCFLSMYNGFLLTWSFFFSVCLFLSFWSAADPGVVETNIMREVPSFLSRLAFIVLKLLGLLQSPENGVSSILDAVLAPPVSLSLLNYFHFLGVNVISCEVCWLQLLKILLHLTERA